ncbi:MAG: 3-isopropylmalate dehydratase small subunit [Pseudomonadota bacterium]
MSEPFRTLTSHAVTLMIDNVDTDQIIPSREMKTVSRAGLADGLFAGWRYNAPGTREIETGFILNEPPFNEAKILISGSNFGCGSSREHAVWALAEYGFRAIIAVSFGSIFRANCARNGLLAVALPEDHLEAVATFASGGDNITVDLPDQAVSWGTSQANFQMDAYEKRLLLEGLDPIGLTQSSQSLIDRFIADDRAERPWIYPQTAK